MARPRPINDEAHHAMGIRNSELYARILRKFFTITQFLIGNRDYLNRTESLVSARAFASLWAKIRSSDLRKDSSIISQATPYDFEKIKEAATLFSGQRTMSGIRPNERKQ